MMLRRSAATSGFCRKISPVRHSSDSSVLISSRMARCSYGVHIWFSRLTSRRYRLR